MSARRSASRSRYRPAMCQARSAGSAAGVPGIRARPAPRGWPCRTGTWSRRSPGMRTRRHAGSARPRLDRHAGDLAGSRRRERRRRRRRVRHRPVPAQARGAAGPGGIAGRPHAAGVMLMPDSRQPDEEQENTRKCLCAEIVRLGMFPGLLNARRQGIFPYSPGKAAQFPGLWPVYSFRCRERIRS